ncbi:DUF192 domain-containing protein [Halobium palmae]|uniref:DUF192 domain-containing protein n=1 Tax=Halobium palmae TaxID=1776492 RepID=A0ABD5RX46_9EURY
MGGGTVVAAELGYFERGQYDRTTVTAVDDNGTELATVEVRVADTFEKRYTGLSDTASLDDGEGMLFVHPNGGTHAYVMREMAFPLDIVFVAENGTVTAIHRAPLPPEGTSEGDLTRYRGRGTYVLEVPMGYTNRTGIDVGDRLVVPDGIG